MVASTQWQPAAGKTVQQLRGSTSSQAELSQRIFAMFLAGFVVGALLASVAAGLDDCGGAVYSPVRYYRMLSQMQDSPWALLAPELAAQVRESKRELLGGTAAAVLTLGAYAYGGGPAALRALAGSQQMFRLGQYPDGARHVRVAPAIQQFPRQFALAQAQQQALTRPVPVEVD